MEDREFMRLYGNIIQNVNILDSEEKRSSNYQSARDKIFNYLLELLWYYPDRHDSLEERPIHFRPSQLMARVVNSN